MKTKFAPPLTDSLRNIDEINGHAITLNTPSAVEYVGYLHTVYESIVSPEKSLRRAATVATLYEALLEALHDL